MPGGYFSNDGGKSEGLSFQFTTGLNRAAAKKRTIKKKTAALCPEERGAERCGS
ncbi:hypothetical protein DSLASN_16240 [Desulfoluna limicola]|uniref:Uncharacterized protein n=1 Tax=Desulfoluna limicola TaxID=2810562 RepID=A0ABN6F3X1_9BACT|nr:hypothetical protein DSLASN_16240 [Desulfoluna limicola]